MSEWVCVEDRVPGDMSAVLVAFEMDGLNLCAVATVENGVFIQDSGQADLYFSEPLGDIAVQPTHWMPLPEPPNEV